MMRHSPYTLTVSQGPLRHDYRTHDGNDTPPAPPSLPCAPRQRVRKTIEKG
jgi:hypothetical protein